MTRALGHPSFGAALNAETQTTEKSTNATPSLLVEARFEGQSANAIQASTVERPTRRRAFARSKAVRKDSRMKLSAALLFATLMLPVLLFGTTAPACTSLGNQLSVGQYLTPGMCLTSTNGQYELVLQSDGNLVVYNLPIDSAVWFTGTAGSGAVKAAFASDGSSFRLLNSSSGIVWSTPSTGVTGMANTLALSDGGIVVFDTPIWATSTARASSGTYTHPSCDVGPVLWMGQQLPPNKCIASPSGRYELDMQTDGNLVLYNSVTRQFLWYSRTNGKTVSYATQQTDGNLVLYGPSGNAVWSSGSVGGIGKLYHLGMQDDGNAVINKFFWLSGPMVGFITPSSGSVGSSVTIVGGGFGSIQGSSRVTFNGVTATPSSWSDTTIVAPIPSGAYAGYVTVTVGSIVSNGFSFIVPRSTTALSLSASPTQSSYGQPITFTATISSGATGAVTFSDGGSPIGTGTISGTTANYTTSNLSSATHTITAKFGGNDSFTPATSAPTTVVVAGPAITGVSPSSGTPGTLVTIFGSGFHSLQGPSTVTIGGVAAQVVSWQDTSIVVWVPNALQSGAAAVVVQVDGVSSNQSGFTVTTPQSSPECPLIGAYRQSSKLSTFNSGSSSSRPNALVHTTHQGGSNA